MQLFFLSSPFPVAPSLWKDSGHRQAVPAESSLARAGAVFAEQLLRCHPQTVSWLYSSRGIGWLENQVMQLPRTRETYSRTHKMIPSATSVKTNYSGLALKDVSKCLWVCSGVLSPSSRGGRSYLWGSCRGKASPALHRAVHQGLLLMLRHTV